MNEQNQKTMTWLAETCEQALTEAQNGNTTLLNRLGKDASFAYYLNNVHSRKVISPEQFASQFPNQVKDLTNIREQYEMVIEQPKRDARLQAVEEGLNELKAMMAQFIESQKPAVVEEAAKPAKKGKKGEEPVEGTSNDNEVVESEG